MVPRDTPVNLKITWPACAASADLNINFTAAVAAAMKKYSDSETFSGTNNWGHFESTVGAFDYIANAYYLGKLTGFTKADINNQWNGTKHLGEMYLLSDGRIAVIVDTMYYTSGFYGTGTGTETHISLTKNNAYRTSYQNNTPMTVLMTQQ